MASRVIPRTCLAFLAAAFALAGTDCYSNDQGQPPPLDQFYFPVGLQVSAGGNVLYVLNSDFDLQYNGGTVQSYDLNAIRNDAVKIIADPLDGTVPLLDRAAALNIHCPTFGNPTELGQSCAPPVDSRPYVRDAAIVGAFGTDLVLSKPPSSLAPPTPRASLDEKLPFGDRRFDRLFAPVRGNASLTWISVERDVRGSVPAGRDWAPFKLLCGKDDGARCDKNHEAGSNSDETGNSRHITMPGEPFGIALSEDGESILITHQNETKTSLFDTGQRRTDADSRSLVDQGPAPSLQFVLDGVALGGVGLAAVPHDRDAYATAPASFPKNAFLQTSRAASELDLLRAHPDEFGGISAANRRPFLELEARFNVAVGAGGIDSRGIVIDPTPRLECKAQVKPVDASKGRLADDVRRDLQKCARKPARVFIANRSPASLLVGDLGGEDQTGEYNPDRVHVHTMIPLSAGPSKLYLAPVVEADGRLGLRVFAVCFDSFTVFVIDPARPPGQELENVVKVGLGPFAMAFDPFSLEDVANHVSVPAGANGIRTFRFAYVASFTNSYVQVIDLDNAHAKSKTTFETVVFTLGQPTQPKGS